MTRGYWFPVFGFAETGMTSCGWEARRRVVAPPRPNLSRRHSGQAKRDPEPERHGVCGIVREHAASALGSPVPARRLRAVRDDAREVGGQQMRRREPFATLSAVMPAKAGIQYPPGRMVARKQSHSLGKGRARQRRSSGCTIRGYWIPVFGCAETGMTLCV